VFQQASLASTRPSCQTLGLMRSIALCEAKCKRCAAVFAHASLGDFAYGESVFSTTDGRHFVGASSNGEFAQRVSALIPPDHARSFWPVLAALADPIDGKQLTHAIVCPNCGSTKLEYWGGSKVGSAAISEATFVQAELSPESRERSREA
jgi:hypothetical protein